MKRGELAGALAALAIAVVLFAIGLRWAVRIFLPPTVPNQLPSASSMPSSPEIGVKLETLDEILRSKNDNDPRLDHDFNGLSPEVKRAFRRKYWEIPTEKRNARGTIVYLLGKNLKTHEDWEFFRQVALEPPCLSLSDCSKKPAAGSDEEAAGDEVTLAYPSLVALRQARMALEEVQVLNVHASPTEREALSLFASAKKSKTRAVARTAASLETKFALP